MTKTLCLRRDAVGLNIRISNGLTNEPAARLDRTSVSRIVSLLLGSILPPQTRLEEVSERYLLTETDFLWLKQLLYLACDSRSANTRCRALLALASIEGSRAMPLLREAVQDEDESIRWSAIRTISRLEKL